MTRMTVLLSAAAFVAVLAYAQPARACHCNKDGAPADAKGECPHAKAGTAKCEEGAKAGDCKCGKAGADCQCGGDCKCGEGECSCMKDGAKKADSAKAGECGCKSGGECNCGKDCKCGAAKKAEPAKADTKKAEPKKK